MSSTGTLDRPASGAVSREELVQARAAQAMWQVAHELELEWRNDRASESNFQAVALAGRMAHDMDAYKRPSDLPFIVADPETLREVIARFSVVVRQLPAIAPQGCAHCQETGFVSALPDQGEVCPVCKGARVIGGES